MSAKESNPISLINTLFTEAKAQGLCQVVDEGESHEGRTITLHGKETINFGSCGYMSLEFDPRVREGGIAAIRKYGIEFSSSRAYLSSPLYPELEGLLEKIFQRPTLVSPTTTLMHLAALPVLVDGDDAVLMDQQVHSSVQLAAKVLKANGVQVEMVAHSNINRIERKIKAYKDTKKRIWYLGDGVYSMYGDTAPFKELTELLHQYEQFQVYLDDAHGMSWMGARGRGCVLEKMENHERLFLVTGLAKGFGTGGGAIVCPSVKVKQLIRNCGGTQIFSGPLQPPILGAAIASAKLHLDDGFPKMQTELQDRIEYCTQMLENQPLPLMSAGNSPILFLGVGSTEKTQEIVKQIFKEGFWFNIAQFPAVAPNHAGLRFMLSRKIDNRDIEKFVEAVRKAVYNVIGKDEEAISQIWKSFSKEYRYSLING